MSLSRRKLVAWTALAAMLFSALSPAMAAVLFADRPEILRHMLALPAPAKADVHDDGCPHEAVQSVHHGQSDPVSSDRSDHAAHGIFCSLCLAASSVLTLLAGAGGVWAAAAASSNAPAFRHYQSPPAVFFNVRQPRGPPAVLR